MECQISGGKLSIILSIVPKSRADANVKISFTDDATIALELWYLCFYPVTKSSVHRGWEPKFWWNALGREFEPRAGTISQFYNSPPRLLKYGSFWHGVVNLDCPFEDEFTQPLPNCIAFLSMYLRHPHSYHQIFTCAWRGPWWSPWGRPCWRWRARRRGWRSRRRARTAGHQAGRGSPETFVP